MTKEVKPCITCRHLATPPEYLGLVHKCRFKKANTFVHRPTNSYCDHHEDAIPIFIEKDTATLIPYEESEE